MTDPPPERSGSAAISPEEAFALLGNDTRVGILRALWDAFDSGKGDNAVPYSALFDRVDIADSGNFSYHLEKLTGPFVRRVDGGYELKQTGINVVRAVTAGTVIDDPTFGPTRVDVTCPRCGGAVEVAYADELLTVSCTACEGALRWNDDPGFLFLGLVPPALVDGRPVAEAFRAAVAYTFHQIAALHDDVCPHCSSSVETTVDVCADHEPGRTTLCPNCDRAHLADVWMVCSTCKRSAFPPVRCVVLSYPVVTAFSHDHGIEHGFATWETAVRSFEVREELLSVDPLRLRVAVPADDDVLGLTLDADLNVLDVAR